MRPLRGFATLPRAGGGDNGEPKDSARPMVGQRCHRQTSRGDHRISGKQHAADATHDRSHVGARYFDFRYADRARHPNLARVAERLKFTPPQNFAIHETISEARYLLSAST